MTHVRKQLAVIGVVLAVAGGCGRSKTGTGVSSGGDPVALSGTVNKHGSGDTSAGGAAAALPIEAHNFYFDPTFVKAAPGQRVTVTFKNAGTAPHTFTSDALGVDKQLSPGESATIEVTLPSTGVFQFHCRFHESQGMQGAFYFRAGDSVSGAGAGGAVTTTTKNPYSY